MPREEDKKMKDKKRKGRDSEANPDITHAADAAATLQQTIHEHLVAYNGIKQLCERVLGRVNFAVDAAPEDMITETLNAKGVKCEHLGLEAKTAVLQYIADHADNVKTKQEKIIIGDGYSSVNNDFEIISI